MTAFPIHYDPSGFVSAGSTATQSILTARQIRSFINGVSNSLFAAVAAVLAVPFFVVLYLVLAHQLRKLRRYLSAEIHLDLNNYKAFRMQFDRLTPMVEKLAPTAQTDPKKLSWYARPFGKLAIEAAQILLRYHSNLAAKFAALDQPKINLPNGWRLRTESELWESRPTPYEYLV